MNLRINMRLAYKAFVLALVCFITVTGCKKGFVNTTSTADNTINPASFARIPDGGTRGFGELHRKRGTKKNGPDHWKGKDCNCTYCFGICLLAIDEDEGGGTTPNLILKPVDSTRVRLYILSTPDNDIDIDPTFYVDDDVTAATATSSITIKAGAYNYDNTPGTVQYGTQSYSYFGTVVVDVL